MTAAAGVGALIAAITGTTVLGVGYVAAVVPPAPPATSAAAVVNSDERHQQAEVTSRNHERPTPAATPTGMVTSTPTPTPSPVSVGEADQSEQTPPSATPAPSPGKTETGGGSPGLGLWPGATSVWLSQPTWVVEWAKCNVSYESWHVEPSPYVAENPVSTASGVGQWLDGTWAAHVAGSGVPVNDTSHAANNTPEQQDRVLAWAARFAYGAWTHGCPRF